MRSIAPAVTAAEPLIGTAVVLDTKDLAALPPSKAEQIRNTFVPMADALAQFEGDYNEIMALKEDGVTPELSKRARRLRLDIGKVRIDTEKRRVAIKEEFLRAGKAIDGTANILKWAIDTKEEALLEIENHAELMEQERLAELHAERLEALAPYVEDTSGRDFSTMEADVWDAYLATKKRDFEHRKEAERAAEAYRVAQSEAAALFIARSAMVAPVFDFFPEGLDIGTMPEDEFMVLLGSSSEAKADHDMQQEAIRREAARLATELRAREAADTGRVAAEQAETRRLANAEAKRVAEEREAADRAAALAIAAAKAPVKARLNAWIGEFALPELPGEDHATAAEIRAKFEAYVGWARAQVAKL